MESDHATTWTLTGVMTALAGTVGKLLHSALSVSKAASVASSKAKEAFAKAEAAEARAISFAQELEAMEHRLDRMQEEADARHLELTNRLNKIEEKQDEGNKVLYNIQGQLEAAGRIGRTGPPTP